MSVLRRDIYICITHSSYASFQARNKSEMEKTGSKMDLNFIFEQFENELRDGSIFGAEKCLKEFRSTCLISFANTVLVQSIGSNLHQKWSFEQFNMHQN